MVKLERVMALDDLEQLYALIDEHFEKTGQPARAPDPGRLGLVPRRVLEGRAGHAATAATASARRAEAAHGQASGPGLAERA